MKRKSLLLFFAVFPLILSSDSLEREKAFGDSLLLGVDHSPTEINPTTTDASISANLVDLLFDTLIRYTDEKTIRPELAKGWKISPDGLVWTFFLRDDVTFHDGTPLDSEDVLFTYKTLMETKRVGFTNFFKFVKKIEAVDEGSLRITLLEPDSGLWGGLGVFGIVPKHLLEKNPDDSRFNSFPVGSGPYRFVHRNSKEILLAANEKYFGGRPFLDQIIVKILPSQKAVLSHLVSEKIDLAFLTNPKDYGALSQTGSTRLYDNWYPMLYMLTFNLKNNLFRSATVRRALNWAVDREKLMKKVLQGKGILSAGTVFPKSGEYHPSLSPYPYQPARALLLLKEAGFKNRDKDLILKRGKERFEFNVLSFEGFDLNTDILRLIQEDLLKIGVRMNIETLPFDDYVRRVFRKRDFEANIIYFVNRPYFENNYNFWHSAQIEGGFNFTSYTNPKVDRPLKERRLTMDPAKRERALSVFQRELHEDPPGVFLFWRKMPLAFHKRFRGVPEKRMETLRDLIHVWVPKQEQRY